MRHPGRFGNMAPECSGSAASSGQGPPLDSPVDSHRALQGSSSSSSRPPKPQTDDDPMSPLPLKQLTEMPSGHGVFLDETGPHRYVLTNVVTKERALLHGAWGLVHGGEGTAMLLEGAADGESEPVLREVGDYLKRALYKCDSGEVYMQSKVSGRCVLVVEGDARFRRASVKMPFGPPKSPFDTDAFVFQTPKAPNQRMFWVIGKIYKVLALTTFQGHACRWLARSKASWLRFWASLIGAAAAAAQLVQSIDERGAMVTKFSAPFSERCLPAASISTFAVLSLLMRWSVLTREAGGLAEENPRLCAKWLAEAFVRAILASERWVLTIRFSATWAPAWPRPPSSSMSAAARSTCDHGRRWRCDLAPSPWPSGGGRP